MMLPDRLPSWGLPSAGLPSTGLPSWGLRGTQGIPTDVQPVCVARMVTALDGVSEASGASSACARRKNGAHVGHKHAYDATRVERNPGPIRYTSSPRDGTRAAPATARE